MKVGTIFFFLGFVSSVYGLGNPLAPIVIENLSHVPSDKFLIDVRLTKPFQEPDPYIARGLKFQGDCLFINVNPLNAVSISGVSAGGPYQIEGSYEEDGKRVQFRLPYTQRGQGWQIITEHAPKVQTAEGKAFKRVRFKRGTARERCGGPYARSPYRYLD